MTIIPNHTTKIILAILMVLLLASGCLGGGGGGGSNSGLNSGRTQIQNATVGGCFVDVYSDPATSEYILPYQVGMSFLMRVGNCGLTSTHRPVCRVGGSICGDLRYAYDFAMPVGIVLLASRGGEVTLVSVSQPTNGAITNLIVIEHDDGTLARYLHLAQNGSFVAVGQMVNQGDPIGLSGQSGPTGAGGPTGNFPHLHFDVLAGQNNACNNMAESGCVSIPITFRNAQPLDAPLIEGIVYTALPF